MGLDQYIFKKIDGKFDEDGRSKVEQIHYWRKNYELNDWACWNFCPDDIYDFNCERLELNEELVDSLIKHIIFNIEKPNEDKNGYEGLISKIVLESFIDCKKRLELGETLYYMAWW